MPTLPIRIDTLIEAHGDRLFGLCAGLDPDPGDAYGAVCEKLLAALPSFDPARGQLGVWSATVAHRVLVDRYRRRKTVVPLTGREVGTGATAEQVVVQRDPTRSGTIRSTLQRRYLWRGDRPAILAARRGMRSPA